MVFDINGWTVKLNTPEYNSGTKYRKTRFAFEWNMLKREKSLEISTIKWLWSEILQILFQIIIKKAIWQISFWVFDYFNKTRTEFGMLRFMRKHQHAGSIHPFQIKRISLRAIKISQLKYFKSYEMTLGLKQIKFRTRKLTFTITLRIYKD